MLKLGRVTLKISLLTITLSLFLLLTGCQMRHKPRLRLGSYATSTLGTQFHDADALGRHNYYTGPSNLFEQNGIVYTCRGGHIDIAHLRIAADHVRFLAHETYQTIMAGRDQFTFSLDVEPTMYYIDLEYPDNWNHMSEDQREESAKQTSW